MVFLKVAPKRGVVLFGKEEKLSARYVGPFKIVERIGEVAYRLIFPLTVLRVHDVFYVSILKR